MKTPNRKHSSSCRLPTAFLVLESSSQEEVDSCVTIEFPCASIVEFGITSMSETIYFIGEMEQHFCTTFRFSNSHFECPLTLPHPSDFSPPCVEIPYQWLLPSESPGSGSSAVMDDTSRTEVRDGRNLKTTRTSPAKMSFFILVASCFLCIVLATFKKQSGDLVHPTTSPSRPPNAMPSGRAVVFRGGQIP